jgi:hypothetical protein
MKISPPDTKIYYKALLIKKSRTCRRMKNGWNRIERLKISNNDNDISNYWEKDESFNKSW